MYETQDNLYNDDEIDIITLRYTLLQCRQQLFLSIKTLIDLEYVYTKVELREDFDKLKILCENLKTETDLLKVDFIELIENCKLLIEQTREILSERDSYYSEWQYAKNILTPRPDWDKCANLIPYWRNLSIGKSSDELVSDLIDEIVQENNTEDLSIYNNEFSNKNTFFEQLSIASNFENISHKNRHMRRRITGLLIKEIWSNKLEIKLTDYVFDYLIKRFASRDIAIEISYNIRDACHRYRNYYEINLFWQILTGQIEENVYHYEMKEFARILQYLIKICSNSSTQSLLWTIQWSELRNALQELYSNWTNERISRVILAAKQELQQTAIETNELEFLLLFMEDDEGHVGEFLKSIREELQIDKNEYIEKIRNVLIKHPLVSIKQFKQAVQLIDPMISKKELRRYVNWVFEPQKLLFIHKNEEHQLKIDENIKFNRQIQMRDFEEIIYRLERCSCFMH